MKNKFSEKNLLRLIFKADYLDSEQKDFWFINFSKITIERKKELFEILIDDKIMIQTIYNLFFIQKQIWLIK